MVDVCNQRTLIMKVEGFDLNPEHVCRTCFATDSTLADVFSVSFNGEGLVQLLRRHLLINIVKDDELPRNICGNCICELHRIHTFITKCNTTQDRLQSLFQKDNEELSTWSNDEIDIKYEEVSFDGGNFEVKPENNEKVNNSNDITDDTQEIMITEDIKDNKTAFEEKSLYEKLIDEIKQQNDSEKATVNLDENAESVFELEIQSDNEETPEDKLLHPKLLPEPGPPYLCKKCPKKYSTLEEIKKHRQRSGHRRIYIYACQICNDGRIYSYYKCLVHVQDHMVNKKYKCNLCNDSFSQFHERRVHMKNHLIFKCNVCNKEFKLQSSLDRHKNIGHGLRKYKCKICCKSFDKKDFKDHIKNKKCKHRIVYQCDICGKNLLSTHYLRVHKAKHNKYGCDKCDTKFPKKSLLEKHKKFHMEGKIIFCAICKRTFLSKWNLYKHQQTHPGRLPFECNRCERRFMEKEAFEEHSKSHNEKINYVCFCCSSEFLCKESLYQHRGTCVTIFNSSFRKKRKNLQD